jgi:hypothetical protein
MPNQNEQSPLLLTGSDVDRAMSSSSRDIESAASSTDHNMKHKIDSLIKKRLVVLFSASMLLSGLAGHTISSVRYRRNTSINNDGQEFSQNNETSTFVKDHRPTMVTLPPLTKQHKKKKWNKKHAQKMANKSFQVNLYEPTMAAETGENSILGSSAQSLGKPKDPPPEGCQATVVIIRHCEKGSVREHCNAIGFEREKYIATLFGNDAEARWPAPTYLFATAPGDRNNDHVQNYREVETIQPLSDKIDVPIDATYGMDNEKEFSKDIFNLLRSGDMCGKVGLVSWKHEDIPRLARTLGCGPEDGCPLTWADKEDFDSTWQISYSYHKQLYPSFIKNEKKNKHKNWGKHPEWWISGHVEMENFDPLQFSKQVGGYQV